MKKLWIAFLCLVLTAGLSPVTPVEAATVDGVWATGYYCVYDSEIDGTQTVAKEISGTVYTLKASFLFGGFGVGMQGTGRTGPDGVYIHYDGGAGPGDLGLGDFAQITQEVKDRYAEIGITDFTGFGNIALAYPANAMYSVQPGVIGAYGRVLTPWRSIAVDVNAPVLSGGTTGGLHFRSGASSPDGAGCISFSVDDRGGGGSNWIDVYVGEGEQALEVWKTTGGNRYVDLFVPSTSEQPQLKAPWRGSARISQGNHGTYSHYDGGTWDNTYAIDIALSEGSDVLAAADGVVVYVDNDPAGAGGKELAIEHTGPTGGKFTTVYCHLSDIVVEKSDSVVQGQVVAKSGSTGTVTGPHLHFHMWSGTGSYDSHTIPIERLVMKQVGVDAGFREYDARVCDLEDIKVANKFFESNNTAHSIDVFMLVDLTGSFYDDLPAFKAQAPDLMATLKSSYPNIRFGLGKFEDYPISPFGSASYGDKAYERLIDLTPDADAVLNIIAGLYTRFGDDGPESQLVALYQAATGAGQDLSGAGYPGASIPAGQQANFRDRATKLFLLWTDAPFHHPGDPGSIPYPGPSFDETVDAILALDPPMVIGISSGGGGLADLEAIAAATGALAPSGGIDIDGDGIVDIPEGEPLVATIGYSGQGIAAAIESLVEAATVLPVADAGGPYAGEIGETIVFDGSGSFDSDGSIVLYEWDFESDGVFDFSSVEPMAEYVYPAEFSGGVTLRVTDNDGNVGTDTSPVEVLLPPNLAPVADAGPAQTVCVIPSAITAMITLDGSGSYDPYGDPLTYNWTWDGNTTHGVNPTVELPLGTTTITLVVNDGKVDSEPDTVDITVNPKPTATVSSNSPVSQGAIIELYGGPAGMASYYWTGPGGWTSPSQNATRSNATTAMAGTYSLVVTNEHGCTSDPATTNVVVRVPTVPSPGGGGAPARYLAVDWDGTITTKPLYSNDRLTQDLLALSPDGSHSLLLERGTHAPIVDRRTHYLIIIRELEDISPLAENTIAIVAFNITPDDAVFDRDIFLTLGLDELQLPENALNVTMAYYDDVNGVWVPLEYEAGGPNGVVELTLSAAINHFSIFGVLAELAPTPPPPPAHFVLSGLNIVTSVEKIWGPVTFVTKIGESVTITANIANDGGQEGTYIVELKLNGEPIDTTMVTLGAGRSQPVSFTVPGLDYGQYEVEVAGLHGEFTASRTINWWLIIGIIVAIGLISWGVVWGRRRRRKVAQEG